jgi:hypothetical protein
MNTRIIRKGRVARNCRPKLALPRDRARPISRTRVSPAATTYARTAVSPVAVFTARAEARAILWQCGEFDLHEAVDVLQRAAEQAGLVDELGQDAVQAIMAAAFHAVVRGHP